MQINIKKLYPDASVPTCGSLGSAGYDLYAYIKGDHVLIKPGETVSIGTGLAIACPPNHFAGIFARSGLSVNRGLGLANGVGVIDSDYRGEYIVALHNHGDRSQMIYNGDRIAQVIFIPYTTAEFNIVDDLGNTGRGTGGFGSTDILGDTGIWNGH